jgi:HAD superfamily hydrolase (TIGR01509 family)
MPVQISALIFDFDGLILDTESAIFQSWQEVYASYGCELRLEKWAAVIGTYEEPFDPYQHLQELSGQLLDAEAVLNTQKTREALLIAAQPVRPGIVDYLQEAQRIGLKVGLASSSSCRWVTGHLERLGLLSYFTCIRGRDDVRITKPDPELYLATAACLGVPPGEVIALEDSPHGVTAAKRAGMFCVAIPNPLTRQLPLSHADLRLSSLADLPLTELVAIFQRPST